jgi:uncharacterized protein YbjT (DUF2867 family)
VRSVKDVFITGGTGYVGRRLAEALIARGHSLRVLARAASVARMHPGAVAVVGDALDANSYVSVLRPGETLVHLVGTPHPSPSKAAELRALVHVVEDPPAEGSMRCSAYLTFGELESRRSGMPDLAP